MTKVDFYFWGDQCPYNYLLRKQLHSLAGKENYDINYYDISSNFQLAKELNIYSPNLIIFNEEYRWNGPISIETIELLHQGKRPQKGAYKVEVSNKIITGSLQEITKENVYDSYKSCAPRFGKVCCNYKAKWIEDVATRFNLPFLGLLHHVNGRCVGGAEFVPSLIVPYAIPRGETKAFLTCVYLSDEKADYKSYPLQELEGKLAEMGYEELLAIASEEVVFPNGPLQWFINREYEDLGKLYYEKNDFAQMHLVRKVLT